MYLLTLDSTLNCLTIENDNAGGKGAVNPGSTGSSGFSVGGQPGAGNVGSANIYGGAGFSGWTGGAFGNVSGQGGASAYGQGGASVTGSVNGTTSPSFGGGGGGASTGGTTTRSGGSGGDGICQITEYIDR